MTHMNNGEAEKCLKPEQKKEEPETATEQAASVFDLRFDPKSQNKNTQKKIYPQILACIAAASFHLPVGIVVGYSAILIPQLEHSQEIPITKEQTAWFASLAVLVVPVGALLTGLCMDKIGRLNTIRVACGPYIIGWILIATAQNIPMLFIGRFLTGFAIAMGPSPAIVYITEVARPDLRGSLICTGPSMTSLGMLLIYIKGALLHWRTVAWMGIGYCVVPIILMFFLAPESPAWLLSKGKKEKALKGFRFLARAEEDNGLADRQVALLEKEIWSKRSNKDKEDPIMKRLISGFSKPTGYKPLCILVMLFFFQQFAGIYITIFYAVTFFEELNSGLDPYVSTIMIGLIRMLVGLVTSALLRRYGRRVLCVTSGLGMTVMLSISAYYTRLIAIGELSSSWVPVACMLLYMSLSVIGLMSIPWTMTAELFPLEIRGLAQGLVVSLAHVIMFTAIQSYRSLPDLLGGSWGVQIFFGSVSLVSVLFVYIFLPETHMKKLSDIQDYFNENTIYLGAPRKRAPNNNSANNVI